MTYNHATMDSQSQSVNPHHTQHVVLVEDDPAIATSLKVTFKREGWQVTWLDNASEVLPTLIDLYKTHQHLSAIILDVGLPDGDGLSLCQSIRHSTAMGNLKDVPIIFLTARSDEVDRIIGLEMGADDYCPKPFSPRELVARLKAIWRREQRTKEGNEGSTQSALEITEPQTFELTSGIWRYQPLTYTLYWQDTKLDLSNTERKLLLVLLANPDRVFSREHLLSAISEHPDHRLARTIDSHIKSIRKQLATAQDANTSNIDKGNDNNSDDQNRTHSEVIYTHRGIGYGLYPA